MGQSQSEILSNSTTTLQKLIIHTPDDLFVLSIIAHDGTVFTPTFLHDAVKKNSIYFSAQSPPNLKEAYSIFHRLIERGMVKQGFVKKKGFRTLITFRGKIYRITKHYTFGLWTFILGLVIGLFSPEINFKKNNNNAVSPTLLPKEVDSLSMHDSGHQKTYQILSDPYKDHTDTTKRDTASAKPVSRLTRHK